MTPPPTMRATLETVHESAGTGRPLARHASGERLAASLNAAARRTLDVVVSAVVLLLLLPLIAVTAILIKIDSPGPVLYRARRVGYKGREMQMLKFRKMSNGITGSSLTSGTDHRLTRVGVWLRRLKLDEIPQMWNVLKGEMSLVGPRPEDPEFVELMWARYKTILQVRPGVTGLSQIAFAEESDILNPDDARSHYIDRLLPQKLGMDEMYVAEQSFWLNVRILAWTAAAVLLRRAVAVHRETGQMNLRVR